MNIDKGIIEENKHIFKSMMGDIDELDSRANIEKVKDRVWKFIRDNRDDILKLLQYLMEKELGEYKAYIELVIVDYLGNAQPSGLLASYSFIHPSSSNNIWSRYKIKPPELAERIFSPTQKNPWALIILLLIVLFSMALVIPVLVILGYLLYRTAVLPANHRWSLGKILKNAALWPLNLRGIAAY